MIRKDSLRSCDADLNVDNVVQSRFSLRATLEHGRVGGEGISGGEYSIASLLRGTSSLGDFLMEYGVDALPSSKNPTVVSTSFPSDLYGFLPFKLIDTLPSLCIKS